MSFKLPFTKMHGLGNDFVMLSGSKIGDLDLHPERHRQRLEKLAVFLCERHFGIGADGLILPMAASSASGASEPMDIRFVYLNSDGSWAEMCGNGIRCFARYVKDLGLMTDECFTVETLAGTISPRINPDNTVTVDMGPPILLPERVPFAEKNAKASTSVSDANDTSLIKRFVISVQGEDIPVLPVSMGNPHCLIFQDDLPQPLDPSVFGPIIETHEAFPAKTNVEFIKVIDRNNLKVTVWERGCGFTLACGTGACATAVAAILAGKTDQDVNVALPGGILRIQWDGNPQSSVLMSGPATYVFQGEIEIPASVLLEVSA